MKRSTILTLGAVAAAVVIGAVTIPAMAGPFGGGWGCGGGWGPGMMHGRWGGHGPGWMMGSPDSPFVKTFDANRDGVVTPEEAKAGTAALLKKHDADGNGTLSKKEFSALVGEMAQGFADRPFTMLDADGDGQISTSEITFPAQMMARMHAWRYGPATDTAPHK